MGQTDRFAQICTVGRCKDNLFQISLILHCSRFFEMSTMGAKVRQLMGGSTGRARLPQSALPLNSKLSQTKLQRVETRLGLAQMPGSRVQSF